MIFVLKFNNNIDSYVIQQFYKYPKGTCLDSSSTVNITPKKIVNQYGPYISFWDINDDFLIRYYGKKICIYSLITYPGIISVKILPENIVLTHEMSQEEIYTILDPFCI
jgi:hypothetical protein